MKKIINIAFIFICFFIFEAKAITDKEANDFVVEIGNQAIKIFCSKEKTNSWNLQRNAFNIKIFWSQVV